MDLFLVRDDQTFVGLTHSVCQTRTGSRHLNRPVIFPFMTVRQVAPPYSFLTQQCSATVFLHTRIPTQPDEILHPLLLALPLLWPARNASALASKKSFKQTTKSVTGHINQT